MSTASFSTAPAAASSGCLHLVLQPYASVLQECLACCAGGDSVVLMGAAVVLLASPLPRLEAGVAFCCLEADVRARGLTELVPAGSWHVITDAELVQKVAQSRHCLSWK